MDENKKPELGDRFDADDIRKLRDYNSERHSKMSRAEVIADIKKGANELIKKYGLQIQYARTLRFLLDSVSEIFGQAAFFSFKR